MEKTPHWLSTDEAARRREYWHGIATKQGYEIAAGLDYRQCDAPYYYYRGTSAAPRRQIIVDLLDPIPAEAQS